MNLRISLLGGLKIGFHRPKNARSVKLANSQTRIGQYFGGEINENLNRSPKKFPLNVYGMYGSVWESGFCIFRGYRNYLRNLILKPLFDHVFDNQESNFHLLDLTLF